MKNSLVTLAVATALAAQVASAQSSGLPGFNPNSAGKASLLSLPIWFDGSFWTDIGYMGRSNAQPGQYDQNAAYLQGRFTLGAQSMLLKDDWFALGRVQLLGLVNEYAKSQYEPHTLDAYVEVGNQRWFGIQLGRFLAWEVYDRGQGIELWTADEAGALGGPALYWLDATRGYQNEAGQLAVHLFPFRYLSLEVAGVYGQESNQNNFGVRPVADFRIGGLQIVGGYEFLQKSPQTEADKVQMTQHGAAGKVQYQFPYLRLAGEVAWTRIDRLDIQGLTDSDKSLQKITFGGVADLDFWISSIGLGYHRTQQRNLQGEENVHDQAFVSYRVNFPLKGLSAKLVYGFAHAHVQDVDSGAAFDNFMHCVRLRVAYALE